jgi:hypothetical protein
MAAAGEVDVAEEDAASVVSELTVSDAPPRARPACSALRPAAAAASIASDPSAAAGQHAALARMRQRAGSQASGAAPAADGAWGSPTRRQLMSIANSLDALAGAGAQRHHYHHQQLAGAPHRPAAAAAAGSEVWDQPQPLAGSYALAGDGGGSVCEVAAQGVDASELRVMVQREGAGGGAAGAAAPADSGHPQHQQRRGHVEQWRREAAAAAGAASPSPLLPTASGSSSGMMAAPQRPPFASIDNYPPATWEQPSPDGWCSAPPPPPSYSSVGRPSGRRSQPAAVQQWQLHPQQQFDQQQHCDRLVFPVEALISATTGFQGAAAPGQPAMPPAVPSDADLARFDESLVDLLMDVEELEQRRDGGWGAAAAPPDAAWGAGAAAGGGEYWPAWRGPDQPQKHHHHQEQQRWFAAPPSAAHRSGSSMHGGRGVGMHQYGAGSSRGVKMVAIPAPDEDDDIVSSILNSP